MHKVDIDKIIALKNAGWGEDEIAKEMHMEPEDVEEALAIHIEKEKRSREEQKTEEKQGSLILLMPEQLKEIYERAAAIGAKEGLKAFESERKKEYSSRTSRRLRNTKLLLRNYHMLKEHAENSVFGRTQMEESAADILESMMSLYDNEVIIESIRRSATRTAVIVAHIEAMFGIYDAYCNRSFGKPIDRRRYEVLWDKYIAADTLSVGEIAKKQHMSIDSVYGDLRVATEKMTALLFGVDGLNKH